MKFLLITLLSFSPAALSVESLVVRAQTYVQNSDDIYLSDIIELENLSESIKQSLRSVKLANGPRMGERQVLSSESISRLIRKHLSRLNLPEKMRLTIPSQVIVENQGYSLQRIEVEKRLKKHWGTFCEECEYQITQLSVPFTKSRKSPLNWNLIVDGKKPAGQFSYQIQEEGKILGWTQGMVRVFKQVPVATRAIHFGERLNKQDFQMAKKEVTYSHDSPAKFQEINGRRIKRAVSAGDVIWSNTLEKVMAAKRGEPVKLIIGESGWQLTLQGVAQMDGQIGDTISVKNPKSQKILSGVLVNDREVQVQ